MPEITTPEEQRVPTDQRPEPPGAPVDVEAEAVTLMMLGNKLLKLLGDRRNDGQPPSGDEITAIEFVMDRLNRLARRMPEQPAADRPPRAPVTPRSPAYAGSIQWQDEFLNLLVRTAKRVKRWLTDLDGPERPDEVPVPDARRSLDLRGVPDLDSVDRRSDLYRRSSARLGELLDQSPALRRLWSQGDLPVASTHAPPQVLRAPNFELAAFASIESVWANQDNAGSHRVVPRNTPYIPWHQRTQATARQARAARV
ncbi:hypothetical protein [Micromonospora sp. NPDC005979]|uniref:hypothetical protein n=1 Tax=Micromonospora sp. NPDC005979 TaxID=3156726 RepID=UPI0033BF0E48